MSRPKILVLTSSFPAFYQSTIGGGGFILRLCEEISIKYRPLVVAPKFFNSKKNEIINHIEISRFGFLPVKSAYHFFNDGILQGF